MKELSTQKLRQTDTNKCAATSVLLGIAVLGLSVFLTRNVVAETVTLTVDQAVEQALENNPQLNISRSVWREKKAASWQASVSRLPRLDLRGNFSQTDPGLFPDQATFIGEKQYSAQIVATHNIFSGGRIHGLAQSAGALAQAARYDHQATILTTKHQVKTAFYNVLLAESLVDVAKEAVEINQEEVRRAEVMLRIGEAARINLLRAEVQLANSIPEMLRARHDLLIARVQLANMIGFDLDPGDTEASSLQVTGDLETTRRIQLPDLRRVLQAARENRSESKSSQAQITAASGEARSSWSAVLPTLDIYGAYNWNQSTNKFRIFDASGTLAREIDFDFDLQGWEIGATASMPLFDFFGGYKGVQSARAKVRQAEIASDYLQREIDLQVRSSYSAYQETVEALRSQEKNVERAREALRLSRQLHSAGEATQLDVQQAQLDLTQSQSLSARAGRDLLVAESGLLSAMGLHSLAEAERYGVVVIQ